MFVDVGANHGQSILSITLAIVARLGPDGYSQYDLKGAKTFVRTPDGFVSLALNGFFITEDKRADMSSRGAVFL